MQAALTTQKWEIVLSDYAMPNFDAPRAFQVLREIDRGNSFHHHFRHHRRGDRRPRR